MNLFPSLNEMPLSPFKEGRASNILPMDDPRYISGKFDPSEHPDFIEFKSDTVQSKQYLRIEVYIAFLKMKESASRDSVFLSIVSATRNFDYQKELWENKWSGITPVDNKNLQLHIKDPIERAQKILEYSAPPGFSRHHWGTDIDINSTETEYFETEQGIKTYLWLKTHAAKFGFCQTYTEFSEQRPRGFKEEKWHWSYKPVSEIIWKKQIQNFRDIKIHSFKGSEVLQSINLFDYVFFTNTCN